MFHLHVVTALVATSPTHVATLGRELCPSGHLAQVPDTLTSAFDGERCDVLLLTDPDHLPSEVCLPPMSTAPWSGHVP